MPPHMIFTPIANGEMVYPSDEVTQLSPFVSKREMESAHLQHCMEKLKASRHYLGFDSFRYGEDPPDFYISRSGREFALEHTVLVSNTRHERAAFIAKIHDRLMEKYDAGHMRNLVGVKVDLFFSEIGAQPKKINDAHLSELVSQFDALSKLERPSPSQNESYSSPFWSEHEIDGGFIKWLVSTNANGPIRGSRLANHTGFEVEYAHRETMAADEFRALLENRIAAKDTERHEGEELLIPVGAPDQTGRAYVAEAMTALHFMDQWNGLTSPPKYLKRIYMDVWGPKNFYVIYDDRSSESRNVEVDSDR